MFTLALIDIIATLLATVRLSHTRSEVVLVFNEGIATDWRVKRPSQTQGRDEINRFGGGGSRCKSSGGPQKAT